MTTPPTVPNTANDSASSVAESVMELQARKNPELTAKQARLIEKLKESVSTPVKLNQLPVKRQEKQQGNRPL